MAAKAKQSKQQMEDMMKALEEEKSHQQKAKEKLVSAGTSNPNPALPLLQNPMHRPKIGTQDKFDGTRGAKAKTYGVQLALYISANPSMLPNERSEIIFAILYLTGATSSWAILFTNRVLAENLGDPVR
ncbi:uncharacterized protein VP01_887g13 [Puccinia sorghi]|uniref:DUF4939 domain-containing protein n=1 Tax=Puccinia sorghi TaxID=27349 RepID=A0A0L6U874_9BASI|nr:uncharacterized protein VP01_887g13 [Puccinia sorghi]